jgi:hypothetical protein
MTMSLNYIYNYIKVLYTHYLAPQPLEFELTPSRADFLPEVRFGEVFRRKRPLHGLLVYRGNLFSLLVTQPKLNKGCFLSIVYC